MKYNSIILLFSFLFTAFLGAEENKKIVIEKADDLPRISYPYEGQVLELFQAETELFEYFDKVEIELLDQLDRFEIQDKSVVRSYLSTLRTISILKDDYSKAIDYIYQIRELHEKPSDKLTYGLSTQALLETLQSRDKESGELINKAFALNYAQKVNDLPWDIVQDSIEQTNGMFQYISENLYLGAIENQFQQTVNENNELPLSMVGSLAGMKYMISHLLPLKSEIVSVTKIYIDENRVEKDDIWASRNIDLTDMDNLTPVVIAVWDSGSDPAVFEKLGKMWKNEDEISNGKDDDGNGFIDDLYGPSWDVDSFRATTPIYPLSEEELAIYPDQLNFTKGLMDLQAAIDSPEAAETREKMSSLAKEDYKPFMETLSLIGNYTHGTHVAGISAAGNPAARIMSSRITFGHELIPDTPTLADTIRSKHSVMDAVEYFKENGVRVVNMSWGGSQAGIEYALQANGVGDSPDHRAEIARVMFEIGYEGLVEAMASAPEILFIPAAGNSDNDVDFNKIIPSSIDLPNVLVVGAVDLAGDETGFTSYGKNVRVHANGFEVPSYVPGGRVLKFSGTSMAAPNVTNLAAKLFAIDPTLTPVEVINLIEMGVDVTDDGRRFLINPKKSVALLQLMLSE